MEKAQGFFRRLQLWADQREDLRALVLVGSFARGEARPDSDIDVVLLTADPCAYLEDTDWVAAFGQVAKTAVEAYGRVTAVRAFYDDGLEVEFGIAPANWAAEPLDAGTSEVARGGIVVLMDRDGHVTALEKAMSRRTRR